MSSALSESGLPTGIAQESERFTFVLQIMPEADPRKAAILACYSKGFRSVFAATTAMSASALLASMVIRKFAMDPVLPGAAEARAQR